VTRYAKLDGFHVGALCDVDTAQTERGAQMLKKDGQEQAPKIYQDLRKLFEDKDIDAVSIATPNHWHALSTIWACQAGKDVYVEKPPNHDIFEGQQMVAAARKYKRMVQVGTQSRSSPTIRRAMELLRDGAIGEVYMSRGLCFKERNSIGHTPIEPVPAGVDWDIFLGPAQYYPFSKNRFRYNWHWFWSTGNGDIGNQGIHQLDVARWGLSRGLPSAGVSTGGKYVYHDDQETPNTQLASFDYGDAELVFDVRGMISPGEGDMDTSSFNVVGNSFLGSDGYLTLDNGFRIFRGEKREPGESMKSEGGDSTAAHMENFLTAMKSRNYTDLHADIAEGVASTVLVHIANISYRLGRRLKFDAGSQRFIGDEEANAMLKGPYREPYVIPEHV
jgi:predicted dehydrogenase